MLFSFTSYIFFYKIIKNVDLKLEKRKILFLFLLTIVSALVTLLDLAVVSLVSNVIISFFILIIFYDISLKESFYYTLILIVISLASDAIVSMFIGNGNIQNFSIFQKKIVFRAFLVIPVFIITYCLLIIPKSRIFINFVYKKFFENGKKIKETNFGLFILIANIIVIIFCLNAYNDVGRIGHIIILILLISFIALLIFTLLIIYNEYQINQLNKRIIEENAYIKKISKNDEIFRHNIINNLLGIKTVGTKKVNCLIDELISDYKNGYKNISNINELPNGIQSIIYMKCYDQNIQNINLIVDNNIEEDLYDLLSPKKYNDMCTSIGILFDNALESVENNSKKIIEIEFSDDEENIYIIIKNTFSNIIDLEKIGCKKYTTKSSGHGIGINHIINLKTITYKTHIIQDMFVSKLTIEKQKKI